MCSSNQYIVIFVTYKKENLSSFFFILGNWKASSILRFARQCLLCECLSFLLDFFCCLNFFLFSRDYATLREVVGGGIDRVLVDMVAILCFSSRPRGDSAGVHFLLVL